MSRLFFAWTAETRWTIKVPFIYISYRARSRSRRRSRPGARSRIRSRNSPTTTPRTSDYKSLESAAASQFFIPICHSFGLSFYYLSSTSLRLQLRSQWSDFQFSPVLNYFLNDETASKFQQARFRCQRVTSVWQTAARPDPLRTKFPSLKPDLSIS